MKRTWIAALCMLLAAALSIGGTMAYLTDEDRDVNVMTLGNVDIEQIEEQRGTDSTTGRVEFVGKQENNGSVKLFPGVYLSGLSKDDDGFWDTSVNNAVDKIVSVKNTGDDLAYVRTMFAFEQGSMTGEELQKWLIINWNEAVKPELVATDVMLEEHEGKLYTVYQVVYTAALAPGATTQESLMQVLLSKDADRAEMALLDPDGDKQYEILVVSQAVQAQGFESVGAKRALEEAFGTNFPGTQEYLTVNTAEALAAALEKGGKIRLGEDIEWTMTADLDQTNEVVLDLNGKTLTVPNAYSDPGWKNWNVKAPLTLEDSVGEGKTTYNGYFNLCAHMTQTGGTLHFGTFNTLIVYDAGSYTLNGENAVVSCDNGVAINVAPESVQNATTINIQAGTVYGYNGGISYTNANRPVTMNITGGTIGSKRGTAISISDYDVVTISGAPVINDAIVLKGGTLDMSGLTGTNTYTITKTGGTFTAPSSDAWTVSESNSTITIVPQY